MDRNGANLIIVENVVHAFSDFVGQTKQQVFGIFKKVFTLKV